MGKKQNFNAWKLAAGRGLCPLLALGFMLAIVRPAHAVSFTVTDGDFVGNVYDFHFYNDLNNGGTSATVINGVNQGVSNPTITNSNWVCCGQDNNGTPIVRYWQSTSSLTGELTMGWDFSGVSGTIESIELKTEHLIFQFGPWVSHATGDEVYGQIATPAAFGAGTYTDIYRETADNLDGGHGTNSLFDITSDVPAGWLANPGLLELKLGYIKADGDIPTRHIQLFRDDTGVGDDGFVLRATLAEIVIPETSTFSLAALGLLWLGLFSWRRGRN